MKIRSINRTNFSARPLASVKVKGLNEKYKLYNINSSDKKFLKDWYNSLDLKSLMPNMFPEDYVIWDGIIESAIETLRGKNKSAILETCNNKICGILSYFKGYDRYKISFAATVPVEKNKRTPFAGQILFNAFFKTFLKDDKNTVELDALKDAPFNPVAFYKNLGFMTYDQDEYTKFMAVHRPEIVQNMSIQDKFIKHTPSKDTRNLDLSKIIELDNPYINLSI